MVPDRHGATAWKHWIFCLTDHLDFENLENRRRYHNPGKPRTAGLCGREVVASDHLPLSSTFFGRPKPPDLTHKTAALVPLPMLLSPLEIPPQKTSSSTFAHTGHTRPAVSSASPVLPPPSRLHTAPHRRQELAVALEFLVRGPDPLHSPEMQTKRLWDVTRNPKVPELSSRRVPSEYRQDAKRAGPPKGEPARRPHNHDCFSRYRLVLSPKIEIYREGFSSLTAENFSRTEFFPLPSVQRKMPPEGTIRAISPCRGFWADQYISVSF